MTYCSHVLKSAKITILKNWPTWKNLVAMLLVFSAGYYLTRGLPELCREYNSRVQPLGVFVFSTTSFFTGFMYLFSYLLIMCDAPFIDDAQTQVILRVGKSAWILGQILYIALTTLVFWLLTVAACAVNLIPYCEMSTASWGRILISMARKLIAVPGFGVTRAVVNNYTVMQAFLWALGLNLLMTFFMGLIVLCVNLAAGKKYGVMFPFAMIFFHWQFLGGFGFPYVLLKISPVSLANLMLLDPDERTVFPSHSYALIFFLTGIALCVVLALRLIRRKPLTASRA